MRHLALLPLFAACANDYKLHEDGEAAPGPDTGEAPDPDEPDDSGEEEDPDLCSLAAPEAISVALNEECSIPFQEGTFTPVVEWNLTGFMGYGPPAIGQLDDDDGDGYIDEGDVPDIVYSTNTGQGLVAVDGQTGTIKWKNPTIGDCCSGQAIGDLNGDGTPEIIAANGPNKLVALDNTGAVLWQSPINNPSLYSFLYPAIADLDGDGMAEVIAGRTILNHNGTLQGEGDYGIATCANASGSLFEASVSVPADMDGDGVLEVVVGNAAYRPDGSALWYNGGPDGVPAIADMDLDGEPEIVLVSGNRVWTLESDGTPTGWSDTLPGTNYIGPPAIDDVDGDGEPEFLIVSSNQMRAYNWDGSIVWAQSVNDSSGAAGPILYDFEMDGYPEVVYADEISVKVFNGLDGSVKLNSNEHSSYTGFETPTVADVDSDGEVEIVMLHGNGPYGLSVYGDADHTWPAGRSVWNQHAYSITNIEDDGGVPVGQQPNWELYNNFRSGDAGLPPAEWNDLQPEVVEVCRKECPDILEVSVRVWNRGTGSVEGGVTVSIRAGEAGPVVASEILPAAIPSGSSSAGVVLRVNAADLGGKPPFVVLDDSAGAMEFMAECDTTNNGEGEEGCP